MPTSALQPRHGEELRSTGRLASSAHSLRRRTSFYAHRVKESLTSRFVKVICSIVLAIVFITGTIMFVLWLSLRPHRPRFYLTSLSFPSLAYGSTVTFNVSDRNSNSKIGIYYDTDIAGAFIYNDLTIATGHVDFPFYQPPKNTTALDAQLLATAVAEGNPVWGQISEEATRQVAFRLELTSVIRFRVKTWDTHHHRMHVSCDAVVGPDGNLLTKSKNKRCSIYFA